MTTLKLALASALLLALAPGCAGGGERPQSAPAAPTIDEQAIALAFAAADELRQLVAVARAQGHACCEPGTPSAARVARLLDGAAQHLETASTAQRLANGALARDSLLQAHKLLGEARRLIAPRERDGDLR